MSRKSPRKTTAKPRQGTKAAISEIREQLVLGDLFFEKCTLEKAGEAFEKAWALACRHGDVHAATEALTGLIRLANEGLNDEFARELEARQDELIRGIPHEDLPAMVWYNRAAIARQMKENRKSRRYFHRYLKAVRSERIPADSARLLSREDGIARGWMMLATMAYQQGQLGRSQYIVNEILERYGELKLKKINGNAHLLMAKVAERRKNLEKALEHFQKTHAAFLAEHNWYYHLHVLYGYARIARMQQNYSQAYFYLDLMKQVTAGSAGFASMQREIKAELGRLEQAAVDLLIDARKGYIKTRESGQISLRKQYVLLNILEALSRSEHGLSKAEIIRQVWNEPYRPEAHDNKLYYNINRLRKLLEPDMREPRYLQNWREGYRLAPGLRVQLIEAAARTEKTKPSGLSS